MIKFAIISVLAGAGLAAVLASVVPELTVGPPVVGSLSSSAANADPLPAQDHACASQDWPHYDQSCKFDLRRAAHAAGPVRVIALR
jgi:hypothetical protein